MTAARPDINGYASDFEVNGDIELELTIAPRLRQLIVYNAPNDFTGQTELDEHTAMASDDTAETISSSYSVRELRSARCPARRRTT